MRAILNGDMIERYVLDGGTEIGPVPPQVGLERLRYDGNRVVDLASLQQIWVVEKAPGIYSLHAVACKNAQLVEMAWRDRKKLRTVAGAITVVDDVSEPSVTTQPTAEQYQNIIMDLATLLLTKKVITEDEFSTITNLPSE